MEKSFYEFKVIELVSPPGIKEHFTFIHPRYKGKQQIVFSDDLKYMLEIN